MEDMRDLFDGQFASGTGKINTKLPSTTSTTDLPA
jgi:hypothetical protein